MTTLPPLFLSHGSPMIALEPREAGRFMQGLGPAIDAAFGRPQAILAVSAHSLTRVPVLLAAGRHEAIHDFGGFDPRLNEMRYDAPGAPALADRVAALLHAAELPAEVVDEGGLDHGIWTPLRYVYPAADVPVLPLAWLPHWSPAQLLALGQALAPLAGEGVLIVGSGSITHNLRRVFAGGLRTDADAPATPESTAFRDWFAERAADADWNALLDYRRQAPNAVLMHPTDEHLLPFFVAAGAAGRQPATRIHASLTYGALGMDAYAFGPGAARLAA
uniref:Extradiol ring-cleavage dioxygenase class III protein subunit B n=1 Tax=uncultured microorganism TaxID=358574 RepID=F8UHZ6_9ZZZZ|nr:extradiol ring-cleavage dioxygenase class III protein subunit B [uncultured microorganism]